MNKLKHDVTIYCGGVRVSALTGPVLVARLVKMQPADIKVEEKRALDAAQAAADEVSSLRTLRERHSVAKVREKLAPVVSAWMGAYAIIDGRSRLPPGMGAPGDDARQLAANLFPNGLTLSKLDADGVWIESVRLLKHVDEEGLRKLFAKVVSPEMDQHIRDVTGALGDTIGVTGEVEAAPSSTAMAEALARLSRNVSIYGRQLVASLDESDPASLRRFQMAVQPLDQHRANGHDGSDTADEATTTEGTPSPTTANGAPAPVSLTANGVPAPSQSTAGGIAAPTTPSEHAA